MNSNLPETQVTKKRTKPEGSGRKKSLPRAMENLQVLQELEKIVDEEVLALTPTIDPDEKWRQMCHDDLISYSIAINEKYEANWHHQVIARELEEAERFTKNGDGSVYILILQLPPRHGKTQLATINFASWFLGKNPEKSVIISSYSGELASDFGGKTKAIVKSPFYSHIFPGMSLQEDTQSKGKWWTDKGGECNAVGIGGGITGKGAHCLILDDLVKNREEADSQTIRENTWTWFTSTAFSRLEKNGIIIVPMTRWHLDDIAGRIQDKAGELGTKVILKVLKFPAISEAPDEYKGVTLRGPNEALWPQKYPIDVLETKRQFMGVMDWTALWQQEPISNMFQEFKREYFKYFDPGDEAMKYKNLQYTICIDPNVAEKAGNDNLAITVVGKEPDKPQWYVFETIYGHIDPIKMQDTLFFLNKQYRPIKVGIEGVTYQKSIKYILQEEMRRRGEYFVVEDMKANNKETRIRGLVGLFQAGVIYHRAGAIGFESELLNFPKGTHDDIIDSLAYHLQLMQNTSESQHKQEAAVRRHTMYSAQIMGE